MAKRSKLTKRFEFTSDLGKSIREVGLETLSCLKRKALGPFTCFTHYLVQVTVLSEVKWCLAHLPVPAPSASCDTHVEHFL